MSTTPSSSSGVMLTKSHAAERYSNLVRKIEESSPVIENKLDSIFLNLCSATLSMWPLKGSGSTFASLPGPRSVLTHIRDQLPSMNSIYTKDYFDTPMFGFAMVYEVCKLYKCASIPPEKLEFLDLSDLEKDGRSIMTHLFIAQFLGLDSSGMHSVLDRHKKTKRFPSLFTPPTPSTLDDESDKDRVVSFGPNEQTPQAAPVTPAGSNPPVRDVTAVNSGGIREDNPIEDAVGISQAHLPPLIPSASYPPQEQRTYYILKCPGRSQSKANLSSNPHPETDVQLALTTNPEDYKQEQSSCSREYGDVRKGNWVASHFKNCLFDGDISQAIDHTPRDYENCARQLKLTPTQLNEYFSISFPSLPGHIPITTSNLV